MRPPAAPKCAWCGRQLGSTAVRLAGRLRCADCGVANTDPRPTEAELDEAYEGWYRPASGRFSGLGDPLLRFTRGRLARRIDRIAPGGPVLDVGAGDGALLDALAALGRRGLGLERASSRADVRAGEVAELDGVWAAIVFWHSLEHLPNPGAALDQAAAFVGGGGTIIVAMPNSESIQARVFGDRWLALDLPRHLVHVPSRALIERLRTLGLEVERISYLRGGQVVFGWLHGLVGVLPGRPDLYDAIRRPEARRRPLPGSRRLMVLASAVVLTPLAVLAAAAEIAVRRGGTVYVEARRA
jgi:hypothetical protein